MMLTTLIVAASQLLVPASATFVVQCTSRLTDARIDPLVSPGEIADHVHVIAGGSNFDFNVNYAQVRASPCTTCNIKEDLSDYWTPKLYYHAQNGSFISVPIDGDDSEGNMGGMAIYYLTRTGFNNDNLTAFPEGFRMFAGDPYKRTSTPDFAGQAIRHRCIGTSDEYNNLPPKKCPGGVRTQVVFPSCSNGALDSADHKSHVSYPESGNYDNGPCPSSHPIHMPTLFYEVTYRTDLFDWYSDEQPFVLANGDATGYSYHGDFINGWDVPTLQNALQSCPDGSHACEPGGNVFTFTSLEDRQACKLPQRVMEQVDGELDALPGCNPVTMNPSATNKNCGSNPSIKALVDALPEGVADLSSSLGWKYLGCGVDDPIAWGARALPGTQQNLQGTTIEKCVQACASSGYSYAGTEYGSECYCGNTLDSRAAPKSGVLGNCNMRCAGDASQFCGGGKAITLYQRCEGGKCADDTLESRQQPSSAVASSPAPASSAVDNASMVSSSALSAPAVASSSVQSLATDVMAPAKQITWSAPSTFQTIAAPVSTVYACSE